MIDCFHIYLNVNPLRGSVKQSAWDDYVRLREAYLKECYGLGYTPLNLTLVSTDPYN